MSPTSQQVKTILAQRTPTRNRGYAVQFVMNGAKKRRELAYDRARGLQQELGVLPGLRCVK